MPGMVILSWTRTTDSRFRAARQTMRVELLG